MESTEHDRVRVIPAPLRTRPSPVPSARLGQLAGNAAVSAAFRRLAVPVQRLVLGADGSIDTCNPAHRPAVLEELGTLDARSLRTILGLLSGSADVSDRGYVEWIVRELARTEQLEAVTEAVEAAREGVWTQATLLVDGVVTHRTNVERSGGEGHAELSHVHVDVNDWGTAEGAVSARDSEVSTLGEVLDVLLQRPHPPRRVVVLLSGNIGPCEGCKSRVMHFVRRVRHHFAGQAEVEVEASYLTEQPYRDRDVTRHWEGEDVHTRYGYVHARGAMSATGRPYWEQSSSRPDAP